MNGVSGCDGKEANVLYLWVTGTHGFGFLFFILVGLKLSEEVGFIEARPQNSEKRLLLRHVAPSVRPFVWRNSASTGGIFMKFDI